MEFRGRPYICETCPLRGEAIGPIIDSEAKTLRRDFASLTEDPEERYIEVGVVFSDARGHESDLFPPHTTVEDIRQCTKPNTERTGFADRILGRKVLHTCTTTVAFQAILDQVREAKAAAEQAAQPPKRFLNAAEQAELLRRLEAGEDVSEFES